MIVDIIALVVNGLIEMTNITKIENVPVRT